MEQAATERAEPGFDDLLERLRRVVERLEQGSLSLEESLRAYEEGVGLARRGHAVLDSAERKVELLMKADGQKPVPYDDWAKSGDDEPSRPQ